MTRMTEAKLEFATAFLRAHPDAAADVLELQPPDVNAGLLESLSLADARTLLVTMLPMHAARTLTRLDRQKASQILTGIKANHIASVLRFVDSKTAEGWLKNLPFDLTTTVRLLLSYSVATVGAWMTPQVMMLKADCSAGEALQRIPQENSIDTDAIYIVNRNRVPLGVVSVLNLLQKQDDTPVIRLMNRHTYALSGRASLLSVKQHDGWNHRDTLPVVNRQHQLIGMLRHADLRKGLERNEITEQTRISSLPVTDLYATYSNVLIALFNVINDVTGKNR